MTVINIIVVIRMIKVHVAIQRDNRRHFNYCDQCHILDNHQYQQHDIIVTTDHDYYYFYGHHGAARRYNRAR